MAATTTTRREVHPSGPPSYTHAILGRQMDWGHQCQCTILFPDIFVFLQVTCKSCCHRATSTIEGSTTFFLHRKSRMYFSCHARSPHLESPSGTVRMSREADLTRKYQVLCTGELLLDPTRVHIPLLPEHH